MASPSLALPGVIFVGEDERARLVAHLGPASGWMIPRGVLGWSTEVSVVLRDAISDTIKRDAKIVMPEEQIPTGKYPLTHQAALKSPLIAVTSRLTQKLVDAGIRVHTIGADRVTSSFYYIAEGGGEEPLRIEGDLVAAVGAMLGDRADNAAIERVLDGLVDRLLRSLSKDRVTELSLELAHALPRAAADGSGLQDIDLDVFEKEANGLVGGSEKYTAFLQEIATKLNDTNERKVDVPLYGDAKKVSQGPFELEVGRSKVKLVTHDRWLATGPLTEPPKAAPKAAAPAPAPTPKPAESVKNIAAAKPAPTPKPAEAAKPKEATPKPAGATPKIGPTSEPKVAAAAKVGPVSEPKVAAAKAESPKPPAAEAKPEPKPEPAKVEAKPEPKPEPAKVEAKPEPKPEPAKVEAKPKAETKPEPKTEPASPEAKSDGKSTKGKTIPIEKSPGKTSEPAIPKAGATPDVAKQPANLVTKAQRAAASEPKEKDDKLAAPAKKEKGFPWLIVLMALAVLFAGYAMWRRSHKNK